MMDRNELAVNSSNVVYTEHPIPNGRALSMCASFAIGAVPGGGIG